MSQLSGHSRQNSHSSTPNSSPPHDGPNPLRAPNPHRNSTPIQPSSPIHPSSPVDTPATSNPRGRNRSNSGRPLSMVQTFQPPLMDVGDDTPPELQPIFTFLNSHSNKLYQEGYFLKLDDQNTRRFMSPLRPLDLGSNNALLQTGGPTRTEHGRNALRSLWGRFCRCGTPQNSMRPVRMARCCQSLST